MSSKRRGIVKESRVELSVREGGREGGNIWFIEVLTHLKMKILILLFNVKF